MKRTLAAALGLLALAFVGGTTTRAQQGHPEIDDGPALTSSLPSFPGATVSVGEPLQVGGGPTSVAMRRSILALSSMLRGCYVTGLRVDRHLHGRVVVHFAILPGTGHVEDVRVVSSTLAAPAVETCLVGAVRRWVFAQSETPVQVDAPLDFAVVRHSPRRDHD